MTTGVAQASWRSWSLSFTIKTGRFYISPWFWVFLQCVHLCSFMSTNQILIVKDSFHMWLVSWNSSLCSFLEVISTSLTFHMLCFFLHILRSQQTYFCTWRTVSSLKAGVKSNVSLYHSLAEWLAHEVLKNTCIEFFCPSIYTSWIFTACQELC